MMTMTTMVNNTSVLSTMDDVIGSTVWIDPQDWQNERRRHWRSSLCSLHFSVVFFASWALK
jgi:hypothetical protein